MGDHYEMDVGYGMRMKIDKDDLVLFTDINVQLHRSSDGKRKYAWIRSGNKRIYIH